MRLAISNIAWDPPEDDAIAALLRRYAVDAIDIAPGKYFPDPSVATREAILRVRDRWSRDGIEITGMQALLFGTTGLNVFGAADVQDAMLKHLAAICRIAEVLGASRLVFGSPRNRDRAGLSDEVALGTACTFFARLGEIAQSHGVIICLEPNPTRYGANFMTSSPDTAHVVREVNHPAIRMQLDTGALTINAESAASVLEQAAGLIGHIHASEPDLVPLGDGASDHSAMASAIHARLPHHLVSIEMVATAKEPHLDAVDRALGVATKYYRTPFQE